MRWSISIIKILGISIEVHITFILFFGFLGFIGLQAVAFFLMLFLIVLAHELVHSITAILHGIKVPRITLLPIGGLAQIELPEDPELEIKVSIVGPLFNFALAFAGIIALMAYDGSFIGLGSIVSGITDGELGIGSFSQLLSTMIYMNLILGAFNLLPAFPMDGGRIFRGILALWTDYLTATKIATFIGQIIFLGLALLGILKMNIGLVIIGAFLAYAGSSEMRFVSIKDSVSGILIGDVAIKGIPCASDKMNWSQFMSTVYMTGQNKYILVGDDGAVRKVMDIRNQSPKDGDEGVSDSIGNGFSVVDETVPLADCLKELMSGRVILVRRGESLSGYVEAEVVRGALTAISIKKRVLKDI